MSLHYGYWKLCCGSKEPGGFPAAWSFKDQVGHCEMAE